MNVDEATIHERLDRIEQQVRLLSAHAGIPYGSAPIPEDVIALARRDERVKAALRLAEMTGMELAQAQRIVNRL